jgi:hypothetical protein
VNTPARSIVDASNADILHHAMYVVSSDRSVPMMMMNFQPRILPSCVQDIWEHFKNRQKNIYANRKRRAKPDQAWDKGQRSWYTQYATVLWVILQQSSPFPVPKSLFALLQVYAPFSYGCSFPAVPVLKTLCYIVLPLLQENVPPKMTKATLTGIKAANQKEEANQHEADDEDQEHGQTQPEEEEEDPLPGEDDLEVMTDDGDVVEHETRWDAEDSEEEYTILKVRTTACFMVIAHMYAFLGVDTLS